MKTTILPLFNRVFSKTFRKAFLSVSAVSCLLFFLDFGRCIRLDPVFESKHFLLCVFTLIGWSFCIALSVRALGMRKTVPVIGLAVLFIVMDYVNYSDFRFVAGESDGPQGGRMMNLYCTYFHSLTTVSIFLIIYLLSFCCRSRFLTFLRYFLYYLFFLFALTVIGNKVFSGRGINEDAMIAILQTDRKEAFHYFFGLNNGLLLLVWIFLSVFVLWLIARFAFPPFRKRVGYRKMLAKNAALWCAAALLPCVVMGIFGSMYRFFPPRMYRAMRYPILYSLDLKEFNRNRADYIRKLQERLSSINKGECFPGKYVVVIGESLNRNFMGCYGYPKNTTPFQSRLKDEDRIILFRDCFSCHVQTQRVLMLFLTSLNQYNGKGYEIADATSIIDIANLYQYHTAWVSGQEKIAVANSSISALAESSDYIYFSNEKTPYRDLDVVKNIEENKLLDYDRSLTFVHLNGNHYPYRLSFPPDEVFDEQDFSIYEKSIRFNDRILSNLYDLAQANDVDVMLYVSDHADAVSVKMGHDPRQYVQEMAEIPLWVYLSDNYRAAHPEIADRLRAASGQVFTNDLVFDLLLSLMGMDNEFVDPTLVPGSDGYRIDEENARTVYGRERIVISRQNGAE